MTMSIGESVCPDWYADGSSDPIKFDGSRDMLAGTTYRCMLSIADSEWCFLQWQQATGGTGAIASHEIRHTGENSPKVLELGQNDIWAPTSYQFVNPGTAVVNLPDGAGTPDSIGLPISDIQGTYLQVRFVVGVANCTRVRFLAQVRR